MLGYPGSGKSYFARQLADSIGAVRLNGDGLRHKLFADEETRINPKNNPLVFGALDYATEEILRAGYSVIYDASHNKKRDRLNATRLAQPFGIMPIIVWVKVPVELAKLRNGSRTDTSTEPKAPEERFEQMAKGLQEPTHEEAVIIIDGTQPFEKQLVSFKTQFDSL